MVTKRKEKKKRVFIISTYPFINKREKKDVKRRKDVPVGEEEEEEED